MKAIMKSDDGFLKLLLGLGLLNVIDAFLTLLLVKNNIAEEANPIMKAWLDIGTTEFLIVKLMLPTLCIYQLWRRRKHKMARLLSAFATLVYVCICLMHFKIIYNVL